MSNRSATVREMTHHVNSSLSGSGSFKFPALQTGTSTNPIIQTLGAGQVHLEAWGVFPQGWLCGWPHDCVFMLPSSRVWIPSSLYIKKRVSQAFEVATVARSFKADLQRNKCCHQDPDLSTLCYMKKGWSERDIWGCPGFFFCLLFTSPVKIFSIPGDRMVDLEM